MYVELLAHSNFTFLTAASHPEELVERALQLNLSGIALTDTNGVYGVVRGYQKAKHHPSFKYIVGSELTFFDHAPLVFLVKNKKAYGLLCKLITKSHSEKEKGKANLFFKEMIDFIAPNPDGFVILPRMGEAVRLSELKEVFSSLYLPLIRYGDGKDKKRSEAILNFSKQYEIPVVASNDVYYHDKQRKKLQDVLIAIRERKTLSETGYSLFSNAERYLKTPEQMRLLFKDNPEALSKTLEIAEQCYFSLAELSYRYPSEWIPQGETAQSYLEKLVWEKSKVRYQTRIPEKVKLQLDHELRLINELNYADYFLTIFDIVEFAERKKILCQGRGSAANSAVCYVLGITAIDPLQMNLLFERFISAERGEPPDIDVDFEHERREEVLQYIYKKYGRERAAMVSAVVTYRGRSAFREVAKVFGVQVGTLSARKVERHFDELVPSGEEAVSLRKKIEEMTGELQGFPRHLTIHSGGFTLSADPIVEIVPVEPARMENRTIIQWDKYDLDALGLLKVDILSLGMLSAIRKTLDLVQLKLYEIPPEDPATYHMIGKCDTVGTFQIESRAQMSMLGRLLPKTFYDLVIEVAIVRPGPIVGKMVHPYLKRRRGLEKPKYPNSKVEAILGKTLGIPLFQEQIMRLAIELAAFSPGEADLLRRSINAWRTSAPIAEMSKKLKEGLVKGGLPRSFAEEIFDQIQGFSQYGFPESHAASFALLAYASCYLKCHFPAEFTCSLINSQPMGFYRNDTLIYDALRHGVKVRPVSFNHSQWDCTIKEENVIQLGFRVVKGLSEQEANQIIAERDKQPFRTLEDLYARVSLRKNILYRLALAGGLEEVGQTPRQALWAVLYYEKLLAVDKAQLSFFEWMPPPLPESYSFKPLSSLQSIQCDYQAFSLSTHGHPMREIRNAYPRLTKTTSQDLKKLPSGSNIEIAGLILLRQKPPTAKGVVFSTLEDEFGFTDLIVHPKTYEQYKETLLYQCFIIVQGKLQRETNTVSVLVEKVRPLWKSDARKTPLFIEPTQYFH